MVMNLQCLYLMIVICKAIIFCQSNKLQWMEYNHLPCNFKMTFSIEFFRGITNGDNALNSGIFGIHHALNDLAFFSISDYTLLIYPDSLFGLASLLHSSET